MFTKRMFLPRRHAPSSGALTFAKLTLLLFTYLVHAYGHGQGSKVHNWAREKGGGGKSDMGGKAHV